MPNTFNLYTSKDVSDKLGISVRRVQAIAKSRSLGQKIGRDILFSLSEINQMRVRVNGRPRELSEMERIDRIFDEREKAARLKYTGERLDARLCNLKLHREMRLNTIRPVKDG